jgi:hypothetical protein
MRFRLALRQALASADITVMKTMLIRSLRALEVGHRRLWLVGGVAVSWAVLLVPVVVSGPTQIPPLWVLLQVLVCGVLLGLARQGVDVLAIRLLVSAEALFLGDLLARAASHTALICVGPVDCFDTVLLGAVGFGLYGAVLLGLVAFPATLLWNRGVGNLRPEMPWHRLPRPHTWWHWALVGVAILLILVGVKLVYVIPSP